MNHESEPREIRNHQTAPAPWCTNRVVVEEEGTIVLASADQLPYGD